MNMKTTKLIASIILIESLLSACGSDGGRGNSGEPSPILEIGASNIQIGDTAEHIIAVAMDSETDDALSVIGEIDGNGNPSTIKRVVFTSGNDVTYSEIRIDENGLPLSYSEGDGHTLAFSNYTANSVDVSAYDNNDFLVEGPITIHDTNGSIASLVNNPLTLDSAINLNVNNANRLASRPITDAELTQLLKHSSELISAVKCGFTVGFAGPLGIVFGCGPFLISKIAELTDYTSEELQIVLLANTVIKCTPPLKFWSCTKLLLEGVRYVRTSQFKINQSPIGFIASAGDSKVDLSWPEMPGANRYRVYFKQENEVEFRLLKETDIGELLYVHNSAINGVKYNYYLVALSVHNETSNRSDIVDAIPYPTIPPRPQGLRLLSVTHDTADVAWDPVPKAKYFTVYYGTEPKEDKVGWSEFPKRTNISGTRLPFLDSSKQYYFAVSSFYDGREGPISFVMPFRTLDEPPPPPPDPDPPNNSFDLFDTVDAQNNLFLAWFGYDPVASGYNIYWGTAPGQSPASHEKTMFIDNKLKFNHTFESTIFLPDSEYYFTVTAVNVSGEGPVSNEVSRIFLPSSSPIPPSLFTPVVGDGEVTLVWESESSPDRYDIYWGTASGQSKDNHENRIEDASSPVTIPSLTNGTDYYFVVTATLNGAESEPSNEGIAIPIGPVQPIAPVPPAEVDPVAGDGSIILSWEPVSGADGYNIYWGFSSGQGPDIFDNLILNAASPHQISNLTNNSQYFMAVTTFRGNLESVPSVEKSAIPSIPPPITQGTKSLNDTGITWSNFSTGACEEPFLSQHDCNHGRDSTENSDEDGQAGFNFTKVDFNGQLLPSTVTDWACVKDNTTGNIWEVKKQVSSCITSSHSSIDTTCVRSSSGGGAWEVNNSHVVCDDVQDDAFEVPVMCFGSSYPVEGRQGHLVHDIRNHDSADVYTWYITDPSVNNSDPGDTSELRDTCFGYQAGVPESFCNTEAYIARINSQNLCGRSNWQLPKRFQMANIVDMSRFDPAIDLNYFPNVNSREYWSATAYSENPIYSWYVDFSRGDARFFSRNGKSQLYPVMLVSE